MFQYFGVKTFPVRDMKRCYLQKNICPTMRDFRKALVAIKWYSSIIPIAHSIIYHYQKSQKELISGANVVAGTEAPEDLH